MNNTRKIKRYIGRVSRWKSLMLALFVAGMVAAIGADPYFYMWETIEIALGIGLVFFILMHLCYKTSRNRKFLKSLKRNPDVRSFDAESFRCVGDGHRVYLSENWLLSRTEDQFRAYHRSRVKSVAAYGPREGRTKLWMVLQVEGEKTPVFVQYETGASDARAAVQMWLRSDCPYCGAPLSVDQTECPYCHSLLGM